MNKYDALKSVRYVFGLLDDQFFNLYKDIHMKAKVKAFDRKEISFVDMGTCLTNQVQNKKYYFVKMVHFN